MNGYEKIMLSIQRLSDYAVLILTCLATEPSRARSAASLKKEIPLPLATIRKVLRILAQHGILRSRQGRQGGFMLTRLSAEISLADILNAMQDPVLLTPCCRSDYICALDANCVSRPHWGRLDQSIRALLESTSLAQMITPPEEITR
ncbi:MAG: SUF system Fe-S cluster assembly regulator [Magnetococcales bacterium]|nr:SUF system Fe-S cluster assembly regulator [Magnetococcales bacterium]